MMKREFNFNIKNIHNLIFIHNELTDSGDIFSDYNQNILIKGFCSLSDGGYCEAEFNHKGRAEKFSTRFHLKDIAHWALIAEGTQKLFDGWKVPFCDGKTMP